MAKKGLKILKFCFGGNFGDFWGKFSPFFVGVSYILTSIL